MDVISHLPHLEEENVEVLSWPFGIATVKSFMKDHPNYIHGLHHIQAHHTYPKSMKLRVKTMMDEGIDQRVYTRHIIETRQEDVTMIYSRQ